MIIEGEIPHECNKLKERTYKLYHVNFFLKQYAPQWSGALGREASFEIKFLLL